MRSVVRATARRDRTTGATLLRRPFAAASNRVTRKAIDSTVVTETAAMDEAVFSAESLAGLKRLDDNQIQPREMPRAIAAFFFLSDALARSQLCDERPRFMI